MSVIDRWAIKICPDCGAQVFGGGLCRQHHPPGHPVETMVARVSDVVVLKTQLAGAVADCDRYRREAERFRTLMASAVEFDAGTCRRMIRRAIGGQ